MRNEFVIPVGTDLRQTVNEIENQLHDHIENSCDCYVGREFAVNLKLEENNGVVHGLLESEEVSRQPDIFGVRRGSFSGITRRKGNQVLFARLTQCKKRSDIEHLLKAIENYLISRPAAVT